MKSKLTPLVLAVLLVLVKNSAAAVLVDTTGTATFPIGNDYALGGAQPSVGFKFSSGSTTLINSIEAWINPFGNVDHNVDIGIMLAGPLGGLHGIPSGIFLYDEVVDVSGGGPIFLNGLAWSIIPDTSYYLVAQGNPAGTGAVWVSGNVEGQFAVTSNSTVGWTFVSDSLPGAIINGEVSSVPEISTWVMMLLGFAGIGFFARRRSQNALVAL